MRNIFGIASVALLAISVGGCSMTETTTTIRLEAGVPAERVRLVRPDAAPVSATWTQEASSIQGQLSFADACSTESVQVNRRTEVTETHASRKYTVGSYIAGGLLAVAGTAMMASSQGMDEQVSCGNGSTPQSGDTCYSQAGAWREAGGIVLGTGAGIALIGLIVQNTKRSVETKDLPSEERAKAIPDRKACGTLDALGGAVVKATLPGGGSWTGVVDAKGAVRIDLAGAMLAPSARAKLWLESVKPRPNELLSLAPMPLGEIDLAAPSIAKRSQPVTRTSGVFLR
jgi:hypothetical protein